MRVLVIPFNTDDSFDDVPNDNLLNDSINDVDNENQDDTGSSTFPDIPSHLNEAYSITGSKVFSPSSQLDGNDDAISDNSHDNKFILDLAGENQDNTYRSKLVA